MRTMSVAKRTYNGVTTFDYVFLVVSVMLPVVLGFIFRISGSGFLVFGCIFTLIAAFLFARYRDRRVDYAAIVVAGIGTVFYIIGCAMSGSVFGYIAALWPILIWSSVLFVRYYFKFDLPVRFKKWLPAAWIAVDVLFAVLLVVAVVMGATHLVTIFGMLLWMIAGEVYGMFILGNKQTDENTVEKSSVKPSVAVEAKEVEKAQ